MTKYFFIILIVLFVWSCAKPKAPQTMSALWRANAESIGYLNIERMALDLRPDSSYRYYYRLAPVPPTEIGDEYTEGGHYHIRNDSLLFITQEANGNSTVFTYGRKFRLLSDTTAWPLRVTYSRRGVDFEVYFQAKQ